MVALARRKLKNKKMEEKILYIRQKLHMTTLLK